MTAEIPAAASGAPTGQRITASLKRQLPPPLRADELPEISFAFNPEKITLSHTTRSDDIGTLSEAEALIKNMGNLEITIDKVLIAGPATKIQCETLLLWSTPDSQQLGDQVTTTPITLEFSWGTWTEPVRLRQVSITYTRFVGTTGQPIRAEARLNLYRGMNKLKPFTNPTSGGPPGRGSHVLDSSECLASVAAGRYGGPGAWRQIARANEIDDPLRVGPGTVVYLPEPGGTGLGNGARR